MKEEKFNLLAGQSNHLKGKIRAPASKSYTTRAIIIGGLTGRARIFNPLICDDTKAAMKTWQLLGATLKKTKDNIDIKGLQGNFVFKNNSINVGESGTLLRLILPILALGKAKFVVNGKKTLLRRSNRSIAMALSSLGVVMRGRDNEFRLPIVIESRGQIQGGRVVVSGRMSSQTISSLLNVAPFAVSDTTIIIKDKLVSRPYIDINIDVLKSAGISVKEISPREFFVKSGQRLKEKIEFKIHGDYSSAAFLMAAACLIKSDVTITDLVKDKQGDREIINILNKMGAKIKRVKDALKISGPFKLRGIDINCRNTPDLVPILCVLGCFAKGATRIFDIEHLAHKESNRITAPAGELRKLGARVEARKDELIINESNLRPGCVSSVGDHRIAMALAVAGLKIGNVVIRDAQCIAKSYPNFISDMKSLGAELARL